MKGRLILVWREKEGSVLSTYAKTGSRIPAALREDSPFDSSTRVIDADELRELVAGREPFDPVFVTTSVAESTLGWKAETQ